MEPMAIADRLQAEFPEEVQAVLEHAGQVSVIVRSGRIVDMLRWLRDNSELRMDHLRSLCGVDNLRRKDPGLTRFEVVYNLYSVPLRHAIRIRAEVGDENPAVDSVVGLWPVANWFERETYDLMGISFTGHPDLRRILMPDDWEGYPLQKDYPLRGKTEWVGLTRLLDKVKELDQYGFDPEGHQHGGLNEEDD
ncbi:MAG: NADH-quinone oxidoreductase subunit C [Desulfobulbus sp.]|jgi:NADH-quinone oxidoreductase subunit C